MVVTVERSLTEAKVRDISPPIDPAYRENSGRNVQYNNEILVLVSAPLVDQRESPIEDLNIQKEVDAIVRALEEVEAPLSLKVTVKVASVDTLLKVFSNRNKPLVIHFTGHGELWGDDIVLNLEDQDGKSQAYERTELRRLLNNLDAPPCQLAVLNACYSERLANEFLNAGVPHVIAINAEDKILSIATEAFSRQFYYALFNEQSVEQSFNLGCESIRSSRELRQRTDPDTYERRNQTEAVKYQLLPRNNHVHSQRLLINTSSRGEISIRERENTNLLSIDPKFVGRRSELYQIIKIINEHRFLMIHGMGGMGKTAIAEALGRWYHEREYWKDGVWKIELRDVNNLATALTCFQFELNLSSFETCQQLGKILARKRCLLILDDVDKFREEDPIGLNKLIEILTRCSHLAFIITGRQDLDNQSLSITQNYELSILRPSESKAAFLKYAPNVISDGSGVDGQRYRDALFAFLDGYPLPIRLAAAYMKESRTSRLEDIAKALNLDPLTTLNPLRDRATRDNSLRETLNLSFQVLPEGAKKLFPLLAFFPSGVSKDLAQSGALGKLAYQDLVGLLNYSMAEQAPKDPGWRVKLPEPARAYAEEKQTQSLDKIAPQVLAYYYSFAQELNDTLAQNPDSSEVLRLLQAEQANLAKFLQWGYRNSIESAERICYCARITTMLIRYWRLILPEVAPIEALRQSVVQAKAIGDLEAEADIRREIGNILLRQESLDSATPEYLQALALYEERLASIDSELEKAKTQIKRGDIYIQLQDYTSGVVAYEYAYNVYNAQQITFLAAQVQIKLSEAYQYQKQIEQALKHLEVAAELYKSIDFQAGLQQVQSLINRLHGVADQDFEQILNNLVSIQMRYIPGGSFDMGSPDGDSDRYDNEEQPVHTVTVPPFFLSKYQITQAQWEAIASLPQIRRSLDLYPSYFNGEECPVERVSWDDAVEFCDRLTAYTGREYRLPSEAEWEYACRAGTSTNYYFGEDPSQLDDYAWYFSNSDAQTHPVGQKYPNPFGLYDMYGNVWEWCLDHWHESYDGAPDDGSAWIDEKNKDFRLLRGGSWLNDPRNCRSAYRYDADPENRNDFIGFRVSCSAPRTL